jgi:succinyl-CoA synthetase beta subunit
VVANAAEAVEAADRLGLYPVTLKAVDETLLHKSDRGGVRVGLPDAAGLRAAAEEMARSLAPDRLFVERTAIVADGVELIVGARQDARFGAVVLVGLGGTLVEVLEDTAVALAPIDVAGAERLLGSLAVSLLSEIAAAHPELDELEVNPLLVTPSGACALDARAILKRGTQ